MNWSGIRVLRGANIWAPCPMLEVDLEVNDRVVEDEQVERVFEHLRSLLPRMEGAGGLAGADQSTTAGPPAGHTIKVHRGLP